MKSPVQVLHNLFFLADPAGCNDAQKEARGNEKGLDLAEHGTILISPLTDLSPIK